MSICPGKQPAMLAPGKSFSSFSSSMTNAAIPSKTGGSDKLGFPFTIGPQRVGPSLGPNSIDSKAIPSPMEATLTSISPAGPDKRDNKYMLKPNNSDGLNTLGHKISMDLDLPFTTEPPLGFISLSSPNSNLINFSHLIKKKRIRECPSHGSTPKSAHHYPPKPRDIFYITPMEILSFYQRDLMVTMPYSDVALNSIATPQAPPVHLPLASDLKVTPSTM